MTDSSVSIDITFPRFAFTPIARPELYVWLDTRVAAPDGGRVLLITGAAGTGKTVLIAQWAGDHLPRSRPDVRVGWVTAAADDDARGLCRAVAAAIGLEEAAPAGEADPDPDAAAAGLISALDRREHPTVLVVDDAHAITRPAAITYLERLLTGAPPNLTVVLCARHDPRLRWHTVDLHRRVSRLRATDLAFGEARAAQLCSRHHCALPAAELAVLLRLTHGWPALITIAAGHIAAHDDRSTAVAELADAPAPIAEFLADEVLAPLPGPVRRFVRVTSVPDTFTAALAEHLTGDAAPPVLHELVRTGFPMTRLARDGDVWFAYHPLLRAHLRAEARRHDDMDDLHLRTAGHYLSAGLPRPALHHLLRVPHSPHLPEFLRDNAMRLVLDGHGPDLFRRLDHGPVTADDPLLQALRGVAALEHGDVARAVVHLDTLYRQPVGAGTVAPDAWIGVLTSAVAAGIALTAGVGLTEFRIPEHDPATGQPDIDGYTAVQFGMVALAHDDTDAAEFRFRHGLALADCAGNGPLAVRAHNRLAFAAGVRGSITRMGEHADRAAAAAAQHGLGEGTEALRARIVAAFARYLQGEPVDRTLAAATGRTGRHLRVVAHLLEFDCAEDRYTAAETLRRSTAVLLRKPMPLPAVADLLLPHVVWVLLEVDATHSARLLIEQAATVLGDTRDVALARASVYLRNRPASAHTVLEPVLDDTAAAPAPSAVTAWLLEAAAQAALDNPPQARSALATAVRHAAPDRLVRPFLGISGVADLLDAHIGTLGHDNDFAALVRRHPAHRRRHRPPRLTATELTVLEQLPSGRTAQQIADILGVSINTVKTHLRGIHAKFGTSSRADALDSARRSGLL
ncbi:LuxR C-terminal-related transcriptional regulator [Nocardia sp. BMG51109]|uniref:helix-turn-helix transcriptional regulator n=1 Tax=Nocardia sp. BMG51109 TaxID=1056816 RepID=UPI00046765D9|nr:LuxR C-terminal-related transcriptional regulator [Nocardia sp. BMG51109]